MSSAQQAALKGKEQRDAALASGDLLLHPYKLTQFQPKKFRAGKHHQWFLGAQLKNRCNRNAKNMLSG